MRSTKAQTEIIGIAIIVIILVITGLFFLTRSLNNNIDTGTYTEPKLSQSMLNSIMRTKTEQNIIVSDLLAYCHDPKKRDLCNGDCCSYAHDTIKNALDTTLKEWRRDYYLTIEQEGSRLINDISSQGCNIYSEKEQPGFYYIPTRPQIAVSLYICS